MTDRMNQRQKDDLDNYITGHYGNDQFDGEDEPMDTVFPHISGAEIVVRNSSIPLLTLLGKDLLEAIKKWSSEGKDEV